MATNTFKSIPSGKSTSFFRWLEKLIGKESALDTGIPINVLQHVFFLIVLMLLYIGITHSAEKTIRKHDRVKQEVDDLRTDYTTMKADYMYSSKQSEVARNVKPMGLYESKQPPYKIILKEE